MHSCISRRMYDPSQYLIDKMVPSQSAVAFQTFSHTIRLSSSKKSLLSSSVSNLLLQLYYHRTYDLAESNGNIERTPFDYYLYHDLTKLLDRNGERVSFRSAPTWDACNKDSLSSLPPQWRDEIYIYLVASGHLSILRASR